MDVLERFLSYVTYWTTSDETRAQIPSTQRQTVLGKLLLQQMQEMGLQQVTMDAAGNVMGVLPSRGKTDGPMLALISHMDTAPDAPGKNVRPRVVRATGEDLQLAPGAILSARYTPGWAQCKGQEVVVSDGTTLLGADDKAGVAELMSMAQNLLQTSRPHPAVKLIFTTDEEIGRGIEGLQVEQMGCAFGYTVDGGALGELEYENFNAANACVKIRGVNVHPGSAKNVMVNALTVAMAFHQLLPSDMVPEQTEGYEGFLHLHTMQGDVSGAQLHYLVRDHDRALFEEKKQLLYRAAQKINDRYGPKTVSLTIQDRYYNMKEKILPHWDLVEKAKAAFDRNGITPLCVPIRGGTDGASLSFLGLPCPNLSTGGYQFHSVTEFIPVQSLRKMTAVLEDLVCSFAKE